MDSHRDRLAGIGGRAVGDNTEGVGGVSAQANNGEAVDIGGDVAGDNSVAVHEGKGGTIVHIVGPHENYAAVSNIADGEVADWEARRHLAKSQVVDNSIASAAALGKAHGNITVGSTGIHHIDGEMLVGSTGEHDGVNHSEGASIGRIGHGTNLQGSSIAGGATIGTCPEVELQGVGCQGGIELRHYGYLSGCIRTASGGIEIQRTATSIHIAGVAIGVVVVRRAGCIVVAGPAPRQTQSAGGTLQLSVLEAPGHGQVGGSDGNAGGMHIDDGRIGGIVGRAIGNNSERIIGITSKTGDGIRRACVIGSQNSNGGVFNLVDIVCSTGIVGISPIQDKAGSGKAVGCQVGDREARIGIGSHRVEGTGSGPSAAGIGGRHGTGRCGKAIVSNIDENNVTGTSGGAKLIWGVRACSGSHGRVHQRYAVVCLGQLHLEGVVVGTGGGVVGTRRNLDNEHTVAFCSEELVGNVVAIDHTTVAA